jgi:signal transduction histidine kinase
VTVPEDRPPADSLGPAFKAVSDAVLLAAAERSLEPVLETLVESARELVGARYAALGVPDEDGGFERFITSGMSEELWDAIGPLPRTHGLLAAMLEAPEPYRSLDISQDPRFEGWPTHHPHMRSFLGVPIVSKGNVIGSFYLTDKIAEREFTTADQQLIEVLAAHAAIAIENARLFEQSRELSVVEERNRLARDLHDSVSQTLFSAVFTAEAAEALIDKDPAQARAQVRRLKDLSSEALKEMRALIFELRPAELEADGLASALRKHVDVLSRVYKTDIELDVDGDVRLPPRTERELFRIAQEALSNAMKHAAAAQVRVALDIRHSTATLSVADDGTGFDPDAPRVRSAHLGLTSMEERATSIGGTIRVESQPGKGTEVLVEVPGG